MNLIMKDLPVYRIKNKGDKWLVLRPDNSVVNEVDHATKAAAEKHLSLLVAYKYCTTEQTETTV